MAGVVFALLWPPAWAAIWALILAPALFGRPSRLDRLAWPWLGASAGDALTSAVAGEWLAFAVSAAQAAVAAGIWWYRRRRDRRRALAAIGAKSAVRLAELVRRAREASRPRPVLRPLPGGAR